MASTNVYWTKILKVIKSFLVSELGRGYRFYISEVYKNMGNRSIRIYISNSALLEQRSDSVDREYTVEVAYYFIQPNPTEKAFEKFYLDASTIQDAFLKNRNQSQPNGFINGVINDINFNTKTPEESEVDGLYTIKFNFTCHYENVIP